MRREFSAGIALAGFVVSAVFACIVFSDTPVAESLLSDSMIRDRFAAFAQVILAVTGAVVVLVAYSERKRHAGEYYALLTAAGAGMVFFVGAENLMTLFLGLERFSLCLYVRVALDTEPQTSLEAGLED